KFDENGLGQEPNNLAAINSLKGYRALRFGRHVDLLITDQHSYRAQDPGDRKEGADLGSKDFPQMVPEELMQALDGGRAMVGGPYGTEYVERAEIYDHVRDGKITGFVTLSGDRHSFWAGLAAKALPPATFEPVGVAFVGASISSPGMVEALEHRFPKDHP